MTAYYAIPPAAALAGVGWYLWCRKAERITARRHPHLMPVWDADAAAPRSVNLATVSRIAANGTIHEYH